MAKRTRQEHYAAPGKLDPSPTYCTICDSNSHKTNTCIFNEAAGFTMAIADDEDDLSEEEIADLDAYLDDDTNRKRHINYGDELRTVTGVVRVMEENGQEENAEVMEEMGKIVRQTKLLHKIIKRSQENKTSSFSKPKPPNPNGVTSE